MSCAHSHILRGLDRWQEVHWHIHQIEANFHYPEPFRFSLNSFIRAAKEVPQILKMELQNHPDYRARLKPAIEALYVDPLLRLLHKQRDFVVHHGMLALTSSGRIGPTEGRKFKIGISFKLNPEESSQEAYERYKQICREQPDFRQLAGPDCDSVPSVYREWKIREFGDTDLLDVCVSAWEKIGTVLSDIVGHLGGEPLDLSLSCRHDPLAVRMKSFSQKDFFETVDGRAEQGAAANP